jgi:molybdate transport system substrate-binding protein
VYAASSLRDALPGLDKTPTYSFAGSNVLLLQIKLGAPADLLVAASPTEPRALYTAGRCEKPVTVATNVLVLLVPRTNPAKLRSVDDLRRGGLRLALGSAQVPVGAYTRTLLRRLRLTSLLTKNTVSDESNVADITAKVAFGSADAGFAYSTDAKAAGGRVTAIALPRRAQPPVRYGACVVKRPGADTGGARAYLARLRSGQGRIVLKTFGFGLPRRQ